MEFDSKFKHFTWIIPFFSIIASVFAMSSEFVAMAQAHLYLKILFCLNLRKMDHPLE